MRPAFCIPLLRLVKGLRYTVPVGTAPRTALSRTTQLAVHYSMALIVVLAAFVVLLRRVVDDRHCLQSVATEAPLEMQQLPKPRFFATSTNTVLDTELRRCSGALPAPAALRHEPTTERAPPLTTGKTSRGAPIFAGGIPPRRASPRYITGRYVLELYSSAAFVLNKTYCNISAGTRDD